MFPSSKLTLSTKLSKSSDFEFVVAVLGVVDDYMMIF